MPATTPSDMHRLFEEAFNAGDLGALLDLYEPDAALIAQPGAIAKGLDQIGPALQGFLDIGGHMVLDTKVALEVGDIAYLANRWSLTGTDSDGSPVNMGSMTAEVARRQPDGSWRYVIDNAWGDLGAGD